MTTLPLRLSAEVLNAVRDRNNLPTEQVEDLARCGDRTLKRVAGLGQRGIGGPLVAAPEHLHLAAHE